MGRYHGVGSEKTPWSWYFRETNRKYPHTYQVWRPHFDQLLLDNSRAHGVEVREGHTVVEVLFRGWQGGGSPLTRPMAASSAAPRPALSSTPVARAHCWAASLHLRRWDPSFQNLAVYGYFAGAERLPAPDETNLLVESYPHGWFWHIPLHTRLDQRGSGGGQSNRPGGYAPQQSAALPDRADHSGAVYPRRCCRKRILLMDPSLSKTGPTSPTRWWARAISWSEMRPVLWTPCSRPACIWH